MKQMISCILITVIVFSCTNKEDSLPHVSNCDGLVTDTAGTGDNGRIYMPNGFTPNGDGLNDRSKPTTQNIASFTFTIYDEYDRIVFTTTQSGIGWEPTSVPGVAIRYFYKIQAVTNSGRNIGKCGEVYLMTCYPAGTPHSNFYFEDQLTAFGFTGVTAETLGNCP